MAIQLAILFLLGLAVGGQLNRGIYRFAWDKRPIGPWTPPHPDAPPRRWYDKVPVVGWMVLRRESSLHGTGYWFRPMFIELFCGAGFATLYWWERTGHLWPSSPGIVAPPTTTILAQYLSHVVLLSALIVATFIDIDEKTIPDEITVPGMLAGISLAALFPNSLLPVPVPSTAGTTVGPLWLTRPSGWSPMLDGHRGLVIGLVCFAAWCYAIVPKTWWTRSGWFKAVRYLMASIAREPFSKIILALLLVGSTGIAGVWLVGGPRWQSLLSSLVGMAFSGGLIWAVRIMASGALGREAMGFGDVTLMAMVGAYVGWQSSLAVFFIAPFAGLFIAVVLWVVTRRKDIAYGPFLSLATLIVVVKWRPIWSGWGEPVFWLGWLIPIMVAVCLVLMAVLLFIWKVVSRFLFGTSSSLP